MFMFVHAFHLPTWVAFSSIGLEGRERSRMSNPLNMWVRVGERHPDFPAQNFIPLQRVAHTSIVGARRRDTPERVLARNLAFPFRDEALVKSRLFQEHVRKYKKRLSGGGPFPNTS